jgi:hypothetical protein
MKRAGLIAVSSLALAGLLIADVAWPKASTADEIPVAAPAAVAAATPEAAASSIPKEATAETSESSSQGTTVEEASTQNTGDEQESKGEAALQHNDTPATDESVVR